MLRSATVLTLASCFLAAPRAQDEYRAEPLPSGTDARTHATWSDQYQKAWAGLLLRECSSQDGYQAKWQPQLEKLLGLFAHCWHIRHYSSDSCNALHTGAKELLALGCHDPILDWVEGFVRQLEGDTTAGARFLERTAPGLRERLKGSAARFLLEKTCWEVANRIRRTDLARQFEDACLERLKDMVASDEFTAGNERLILGALKRTFSSDAGQLDHLEALEAAAARPVYALLVWRAEIENALAWAERGQVTAASIGERERNRFLEHVKAGLAAGERAYELCPDCPEAPTMMVANLGVVGGGTRLRVWFDRAVAAQFDYEEAYGNYAHYLQPRWGGSPRALQDFGEECLTTGRFDTAVPETFVSCMRLLSLDARDPTAFWKRSAVQERLEQMAKGYTANATNQEQKTRAATHEIARLALGGKVEEAAAEYERQREVISEPVLQLYSISLAWLYKTLRPHMQHYVPAEIPSLDYFAGYETAAYPGVDIARPLASHDHARTARQVKEARAAWFGRSYVAAYERFGKHDARWDADARALLERAGELVDDATSETTHALARKLLDGKCEDPLVLFLAVWACPEDSASKRLRRTFEADEGIEALYTPAFQWFVKSRLWYLARAAGRSDLGDGLLSAMRDRMARAISDPIFAGEDRCQFISCLFGTTRWLFPGTAWATADVFTKMAEIADADPWIVHAATGLHLARLARYVESADRVRIQQANDAKAHLLKAYELHPELPEAAVGMITVAAMLQLDGENSPRVWLDRALDVQIDCTPALNAFVDSLLPGFTGSLPAMYRFAQECLDSGRFDTELPLWYALTMQQVVAIHSRPRWIWNARNVDKALERMFAGYQEKGLAGHAPSYFESGRCLTAWASGHYATALAARAAAGPEIDQRWLEIAGIEDLDLVEIDLKAFARQSK